ncbi:hypothetical protein ABTY61_22605 [Kitasatospora sp. NPDC096128]|uniref:hypothetical protein n=1 Tax=Kitasatospora sp. NPDC096128 TaxID=3155547 RepID=UPI00332E519A
MGSREEMWVRVAGERVARPGRREVSKTTSVYLVSGSGPGGSPVNRQERRKAQRKPASTDFTAGVAQSAGYDHG